MFTGIIHHLATVVSIHPTPAGVRLVLTNPFAADSQPKAGDSIATNGVCLTVVSPPNPNLHFDVIPETLQKTNLNRLAPGHKVHLEQSLRAGDRIDGHFVQGHVDGTATVTRISTQKPNPNDPWDAEYRLHLQCPPHLIKYLIPKGSVSLDGVSLTLANIDANGQGGFEVALIPTTLNLTTLGQHHPGDQLNLECDATAKTIVTTLERMKAAGGL
jgi:riboflavin synthase